MVSCFQLVPWGSTLPWLQQMGSANKKSGKVAVMLLFWGCWSAMAHNIGVVAAPQKNGCICHKSSQQENWWYFRFYSLFSLKKKSYLMKQIPNKPHLNIIFLTLWLCFKLFPNFLSEKWLIIIINSGKTNIKALSLVPPKVPCLKKSQCVYLLSCTIHENMVVLHYQSWL